MKRPYIHYPDMNPQSGENHRTVAIRYGGNSISIRCDTRERANMLGKALVGTFARHLPSRCKPHAKPQQ